MKAPTTALHFVLRGIACILTLAAVHAEPQITELVAINASSLTDGDGNSPDWIELHNPEATPVDISGYQLTDDIELPNQYVFPDGTMIPGGGYLIVFASGKSEPAYTDPEGNLHTNFSLDGGGEYLALSDRDGAIIQTFDPEYPRLFEDASYGIGTSVASTPLVTADSTSTWLVPGNDIGADWQMPNFDDAAWTTAEAGIGYGHDELVSTNGDTRSEMWFGNPSVYLRLPFEIEDATAITSLMLRMRYDDGFVAYLNGARVASANSPDDASLSHSSTATAERPDDQVALAESFTIPPSSLVSGTNILAIHGLNFSSSGANSADFLALPELDATSTDASGAFGYFTAPTPGEPNGATPLLGFVEDTKFSHDRGYHTEAFDLAITTDTPDATILYTSDGTPPSIFTAIAYTAPIPITATTTIRAIATKSGFQSTNIDTQTYLFVDDIIRQTRPAGYPSAWGGGRADYDMDPDVVDDPAYADTFDEAFAALPTLSLVFDPNALFHASTGIYQRPDGEGSNWERPVSTEFIVPDGSEPGFQVNAGIRVQGGSSRSTDTPKHSFSLRFRAEYGAEKLRYPLYQNTPNGDTAVERFDVLQLRPEYNFGWMHRHWYQALHALYGRDQWASDLFTAMGQNGSHGRWTHLFLNGIYWGLYDLHERPDADHMANYFGGTDDDYDTVNSSVATRGDLVAYNEMMDLAYGSIQDESTYEEIQDFLNIDAFIDYMILNAYVGNRDWDGHNWRAARKREPGAGYLFFAWDTEFAASHVGGGRFTPPDFFSTALATDVTGNNGNRRPTGLQQRLATNREYRVRYGDRVNAHFFNGGPLTPERAAAMWTARSTAIGKAIVAESARWGDFRRDVSPGSWTASQFDLYTRDAHYLPVLDWLLETYIPERSDIVIEQLQDRDLYPKTKSPVFSQHGGTVPRGFELSMSSTVFYTTDGTDPRLSGGAANLTAENLTAGSSLTLNESTRLKARSRTIFGDWSALTEAFFSVGTTDLHLSEIMYQPETEPLAEFLELHNTSASELSLAGLHFSRGITFDFDQHSSIQTLAPDARLLLIRDLAAFQTVHGDAHDAIIAGSFQDGSALSNSGETLAIADANGATILSVTYNDNGPWPKSADGRGRSLISTGSDPTAAQNWRPSATNNGNPGTTDSTPFTEGSLLDYALTAPPEINNNRALTYITPLTADDATITLEQSSDLTQWQVITPEVESQILDAGMSTRAITVQLPEGTLGFVRVVITQ